VVPATPDEMRLLVVGNYGENFDAGSRVLDSMYDGSTILKAVDRDHVEIFSRVRTPPMVKDRDFVFAASSIMGLPSGAFAVQCESVVRDDAPKDPKRVRGEILCNSWYCTPLSEEEASAEGFEGCACTRCTYMVCVDVGGMIPAVAVNLMTGRQARVALAARKHFEQRLLEAKQGTQIVDGVREQVPVTEHEGRATKPGNSVKGDEREEEDSVKTIKQDVRGALDAGTPVEGKSIGTGTPQGWSSLRHYVAAMSPIMSRKKDPAIGS